MNCEFSQEPHTDGEKTGSFDPSPPTITYPSWHRARLVPSTALWFHAARVYHGIDSCEQGLAWQRAFRHRGLVATGQQIDIG